MHFLETETGKRDLGCHWLLSQVRYQGPGSEVWQLGLQPVPVGDVGLTGHGFTCCAAVSGLMLISLSLSCQFVCMARAYGTLMIV